MARRRIAALLIAGIVTVTADALAKGKLDAERDLIVFVGKRLKVTPQPETGLDLKFEAHFRVVELVFGRYDRPEITFTVYDHYGWPAFARYETALMFVSRYEGKLYHEKYLFTPVFS